MTRRAEDLWQVLVDLATNRWCCPLCDFSTSSMADLTPTIIWHATSEHPAYLPDRQTVTDILDSIPRLIREAWATLGAPNPDGRPGRGSRQSGSRAPVELWTIDALRPDDGAWGRGSALITRLCECSRIIWDAMDAPTRKAHPQPKGEPKWSSELAWLRKVWPDAQSWLDECDFGWVEDEVKAIRGVLASIVKLRPKPRNLCPDCREPMHLDDSDWLTCEAGHQHPGPKRMESQWRRKSPMGSRDLCEALRIPRGTLRRWAHEGKIKPTRQEGQEQFWLPWDAIGLRYPDIVTGIEERDAARVA